MTSPSIAASTQNHVVYEIYGHDKHGAFSGVRRYNHFHALKNALAANYPGLYVPGIPPKKTVGNKDVDFIVERRYFLERFLLNVHKNSYLHPITEV